MSTDLLLADARASAARGAAFGRLLRPAAARLPVVVLLAAGSRTGLDAHDLVGGIVLIVAAYGAAAAFNDVHDLAVDRANGRHLPLVDGTLTPDDARWAAVGCLAVVAAAQVLLPQPRGVLVTLAAVVLSVAYSHPALGVERRGAWATALLTATYVALPLVLAGPLPGPARTAALLLAAAAMLLYKDVKDEVGDRAHGKRTPLVRWGVRRMDRTAAVLLLVATVAALATTPRWPALVVAGACVAQQRMVRRGARSGWPLLAFQAWVVGGAVALAAV